MSEASVIEVPLGAEAHRIAGQFAIEQAEDAHSKQIYLNTLAVYAVHRYLSWFQIKTNLKASDSWDPVLRNRYDLADLVIPDFGRLECRPIIENENTLEIPSEVSDTDVLSSERIAYLAVKLDENLDRALLLGFKKTINAQPLPQSVPLDQLESMDSFFKYFGYIEDEFLITESIPIPSEWTILHSKDVQREEWEQLVKGAVVRFRDHYFNTLTKELRKSLKIPSDAQCLVTNVDFGAYSLDLLAIIWSEPQNSAQISQEADNETSSIWKGVLVLSQHGGLADQDIAMTVRNLTQCQILSQDILEKDEEYFKASFEVEPSDRVSITLSLNGEIKHLRPFLFEN